MIKIDPKTGKLKATHGSKFESGEIVYYGFKKDGIIAGLLRGYPTDRGEIISVKGQIIGDALISEQDIVIPK
jgi:hypothetical protein